MTLLTAPTLGRRTADPRRAPRIVSRGILPAEPPTRGFSVPPHSPETIAKEAYLGVPCSANVRSLSAAQLAAVIDGDVERAAALTVLLAEVVIDSPVVRAARAVLEGGSLAVARGVRLAELVLETDPSGACSSDAADVGCQAEKGGVNGGSIPEGKPFRDGSHVVGADVAPGTYRTFEAARGCYWARLAGFSGEMSDLIANGNESGPTIVTIWYVSKRTRALLRTFSARAFPCSPSSYG